MIRIPEPPSSIFVNPISQPSITWPWPSINSKGWSVLLLSNSDPSNNSPIYSTDKVSPFAGNFAFSASTIL